MVGQLSSAALHITCSELNLNKHLVKADVDKVREFRHEWNVLIISFNRLTPQRNTSQNRQFKILLPVLPQLSNHYFHKEKGKRRALKYNLRRLPADWGKTDEEQSYANILNSLVEQLLVLLNAETVNSPAYHWQYVGFHPFWLDNALIDRFNKRVQKEEAERRKREREAERRQKREAEAAASGKPLPDIPKTGAGRRPGAIPGIFKGIQFRSQLEIRFATELEDRQIRWEYEAARLGESNYLVDFYLPDYKCWVEVKGRFEPRDLFLLKDVAAYLKRERGEKLYVYTQSKVYTVNATTMSEMKRDDFWRKLV
ncbi:MAG TPA: hypothetical protein VHO69_14860 [Phototrophicaceae bacterium]|nr:hypothetical protein [Phototrophicaceae bacterium]